MSKLFKAELFIFQPKVFSSIKENSISFAFRKGMIRKRRKN